MKKEAGGQKKQPTGLADRVKNALFGAKKAKTSEPTAGTGSTVTEQGKAPTTTENTAPKG